MTDRHTLPLTTSLATAVQARRLPPWKLLTSRYQERVDSGLPCSELGPGHPTYSARETHVTDPTGRANSVGAHRGHMTPRSVENR